MPSSSVQAEDAVSTIVGPSNIPELIRRLTPMTNPDYADVFTMAGAIGKEKTPEQWARAAFEETPSVRRAASLAWGALGLRLGPRHSPDHVHGWRIAESGEDWIRIENASWYMTTHLVLYADEEEASLALFVRYDRPVAALIWPQAAHFHRFAGRRLMPTVLRRHR